MSTPNASAPGPQPNPSSTPDAPAPQEAAQPEASATAAKPSRTRKATTPESLARQLGRLDTVLALLVLVFAFFVASFAARNSDLWMDLAVGRLMTEGQYRFGTDPFAFTTPRTDWTWINHAWLYDWFMYRISETLGGIETAVGGGGLVVLKAIVITAMAAIMLWLGRRGFTLWVPAVVVALALLAMSPWLLLQPVFISLFFLAATLAILYWPRLADAAEPRTLAGVPRHWWLLPLLFVLWVNLDDWFLLGPLTVALYLLGEAAQLFVTTGFPGVEAPRPRDLRALAGVLLLGLAACLLNPYHIHAFTLPQDVAAWFLGRGAEDLAFARGRWMSPFAGAYVQNLWATKNVPGFAYYGLLLLGVVSFVVNWAGLRFSRLLLWLAFGLLSIGLTAAIPLFGVVGGAITAMNFQEWALRRLGAMPRVEGRLRHWSIAGRYLTLVAGLAVLALAWPGFLHPGADDYRRTHRVTWRVDVDPSYRQAARKLGELRDRNVLAPDAHGFNFTPELADYCAWFCPREKGFIDHRLPLFGQVSGSFRTVRRALMPESGHAEDQTSAWQAEFRNPDHPMNHVILSLPSARPAAPSRRMAFYGAFLRLWDDPAQWTMLYGDGRTFIFGWKDLENPAAAAAFTGHAIHFNALAFGPDLPPADRAPAKGPELPAPRTLWDLYTQGPAPSPLENDTAVMYQLLFGHVSQWPDIYFWLRLVPNEAVPAGVAPAGEGLAALALAAVKSQTLDRWLVQDRQLHGSEPDPAALLLLAVRAARQALAANPEDAASYGQLGLIYQQLSTRDRVSRLRELRQIQTVTALQRALRFQPDNPDYHRFLALELLRLSLPDLAADHVAQSLAAIRAAGPQPGETPEDFQKRIQSMEDDLKAIENQFKIAERTQQLDKVPANAPPLSKAQFALQLGLAKAAMESLRAIDPTVLNEQEKYLFGTMYSKLMIRTGQGPENVGVEQVAEPWDRVLLAAANGDYTDADGYLEKIQFSEEQSPRASAVADLMFRLKDVTFQGRLSPDVWSRIAGSTQAPAGWADLAVVRGALALEAGDTTKARSQFRRAQALYNQPLETAKLITPLAAATPLEEFVLLPLAGPHRRQRFPFAGQGLVFHYLQFLQAAERQP